MLWPIAKIKFDDSKRIRQDLDPDGIKELAESIENIGLLNPIIIDRNHTLIAGRRRLEAHRLLKRDEISVSYFEDLDPTTQKIVELDENRKRKQLTWDEEARAVYEIHTLLSAADIHHTLGETAQRLGVSIGKVSQDVMLARSLDNERVASAGSLTRALQTVKRERELDLVRELSRRQASSVDSVSGSTSRTLGHGVIYNSDCNSILPSLEDESVDLIVTDPPWGIEFEKAAQWTKKWIMSYDDNESIYRTLDVTIPHLYRVLKPGGHLYIFFPIQNTGWWIDALGAAGFTSRNRPLIWHKNRPSISEIYTSFLPSYESILWAFKAGEGGYRRFFSRPIAESYAYPRDSTYHENGKPTELLTHFVEASSDVNDLILDPFAGGGSSLAAAYAIGRRYIGIEADAINYERICKRMGELESGNVETEG